MKHKLAIIGLGIMGRRMLESAVRHPEFEVTGVWGPSPDAIAKTRALLPNAPIAQSRDLLAELEKARLPSVVNFTQAASRGFEELSRAIHAGEVGELLGIDIVVNYLAWPRAWQKEADWLRFRHEGGYTREVISHFLFLAARYLGPLTGHTKTHVPALCNGS
jgi:predicted dehydrogenase